jgi:hypothetical protein
VHDGQVVDAMSGLGNLELDVQVESEQLQPKAAELRLRIQLRERGHRNLSKAKESCSQNQKAPGLSIHLAELIALIGLPGGLSARGLVNVAVPGPSRFHVCC